MMWYWAKAQGTSNIPWSQMSSYITHTHSHTHTSTWGTNESNTELLCMSGKVVSKHECVVLFCTFHTSYNEVITFKSSKQLRSAMHSDPFKTDSLVYFSWRIQKSTGYHLIYYTSNTNAKVSFSYSNKIQGSSSKIRLTAPF